MTDLSQQSPTKRPWASKNVTKYPTLYKVLHTAITPPQFVWTIKIARQQTMAPSSNDCRSAKLPQGNLRHANRLFKKHVSWNVSMQKLQLSELAKDGGRDSCGAKRHVIRRYCISATLELRSSDGKKNENVIIMLIEWKEHRLKKTSCKQQQQTHELTNI